ncbi:MAG: acyl-CoA reductase [Sediminibacterium sp.]|nr:acyl-CoA reductase [Sediminibacterium sp.]
MQQNYIKLMNFKQNSKNFIELRQILLNNTFQQEEIVAQVHINNKWFIPEFSRYAIKQIMDHYLNPDIILNLPEKYPYLNTARPPKVVGVLAAGNIPLAGFLDLLCVLLSGHKLKIKTSQKDTILMKYIIQLLLNLDKNYYDYIEIAEQLKNCDAFIGSGSDQTINLFKHYVQHKPNLLRGHKTSIAIISGNETEIELEKLADDIFLYFGMGCRSISKLFLPTGYQVERLLNHWKKYEYLKEHYNYKQNIDYQYAIAMLNKMEYIYSDYILLRRNTELKTPLGCLDFDFYESKEHLLQSLNLINNQLQCIVGKGYIEFGTAQQPRFFDYPDDSDILKFLEGI